MRPPALQITHVKARHVTDPPRQVLKGLAEDGVAILVDEDDRPVAILTYSDMPRLRTIAGTATQAGELFETGRELHTVVEGDRPRDVAEKLVRRGLKTGIVAVDEDGRYLGYVFVRDLRTQLREIQRERKRLEENLDELRQQHPVPFERVERIFKSGADD